MTTIRYTPKQFETPDEGVYWATPVEIKELGIVPTANGDKEKIQFIWELDDLDSRGNHLRAFQRFNKTLHPNSSLSQAIFDITGKEPGEEYELDDLLGLRVQLAIKHNPSDATGKVYANVAAILRPKTAREEAEERRVAQVREQIRKQATATKTLTAPAPVINTSDEISDEDIPL